MVKSQQNTSTVTDLLDLLVQGHEALHWKLCCCFSDGQGSDVMEITFYEGPYRRIKGRITFNATTGKTLNLRYRGYRPNGINNIVDTLLDLMNFEKYQHASV